MSQNGRPKKSVDPADYQQVPRAMAAMPADYPTRHRIPAHTHTRGQLLLAVGGVMEIATEDGIWVVPHGRAVWIPAAVKHSIYVIRAVSIHSLYIAPEVQTGLSASCRVLAVSELLRALISAAMAIPVEYVLDSRDGLIMQLILHELESMPFVPLHAPMPKDARLRAICQAIIETPSRAETLDQWGSLVGATARTLANLFQADIGLSFGHWRRQARLIEAIRRLAEGQPVGVIAGDLGYSSESAFIAMFRRSLGTTPTHYFDVTH